KNFFEPPRTGGDGGNRDNDQQHEVITFPNRCEDRGAVVVDQSKDPVIELIVVLGEVTDVGDKNDRAQTEGDDHHESAHSLMPDAEVAKESDQRERKRWQECPSRRRCVRLESGIKATKKCLRSRWLCNFASKDDKERSPKREKQKDESQPQNHVRDQLPEWCSRVRGFFSKHHCAR